MIARASGPSSRAAMFFMSAIRLTLVGAGCRQPPLESAATSSSAPAAAYAPRLGEIMALQQMRHTKRWLTGEAGKRELRPLASSV